MSHGFRIDRVVTEAAYRNGIFMDRGSFFSLPDSRERVHVHLEGQDRSVQRLRCWMKSKGRCAVCGLSIDRERFEMHHPGTCDCIDPRMPNARRSKVLSVGRRLSQHRRAGFKRTADVQA